MNKIQPDDFIYKLRTKGGLFQLKHSPIGWKDYGTSWGRSNTHYGYGRKYTVEIRFVKDGYDILLSEYTQYGVEADVQLEIHRLDRQQYTYSVDMVSGNHRKLPGS